MNGVSQHQWVNFWPARLAAPPPWSHPGSKPWPMGCLTPLWAPNSFVQPQADARAEAVLSTFGASFGDITDVSPPPSTWRSPPWLPNTLCACD